MALSQEIGRLGEAIEHQNQLLSELRALLPAPPRALPRIGSREPAPLLTDGDFMVRHVPALQLAFKRQVPAKHVELAPELARVTCPCGAVVELEPRELSACPGPEGSDCPRFYLYTCSGGPVHVANPELLNG